MFKTCSKCHEGKDLSGFSKDKSAPDGLATWCKACVKVSGRSRYLKDLRVTMLRTAKANARVSGNEFSLTLQDMPHLPTTCPILGLPLHVGTKGRSDNSPSLDRIDNSKGYIPGNVVIISWRANRLKGSATADELKRLAAFYSKDLPE